MQWRLDLGLVICCLRVAINNKPLSERVREVCLCAWACLCVCRKAEPCRQHNWEGHCRPLDVSVKRPVVPVLMLQLLILLFHWPKLRSGIKEKKGKGKARQIKQRKKASKRQLCFLLHSLSLSRSISSYLPVFTGHLDRQFSSFLNRMVVQQQQHHCRH